MKQKSHNKGRYLVLATEEDWGALEVRSEKSAHSLPHQKEQTCLAACLKLAYRGTEQSHPSPASSPPASWLCFRIPAELSQCSVVSAWKSKGKTLYGN